MCLPSGDLSSASLGTELVSKDADVLSLRLEGTLDGGDGHVQGAVLAPAGLELDGDLAHFALSLSALGF